MKILFILLLVAAFPAKSYCDGNAAILQLSLEVQNAFLAREAYVVNFQLLNRTKADAFVFNPFSRMLIPTPYIVQLLDEDKKVIAVYDGNIKFAEGSRRQIVKRDWVLLPTDCGVLIHLVLPLRDFSKSMPAGNHPHFLRIGYKIAAIGTPLDIPQKPEDILKAEGLAALNSYWDKMISSNTDFTSSEVRISGDAFH